MADRYWVGGTASWDGTAGTKWSATSGGAGGASVPTTADAVFFDAASGAVTCTIATGNTNALSITCTGFTGTLAGTAAITVAGGITLVAGMTYTHTGTMTITGSGTLTTAGKTFSAVTVNGSGITVTLGDAFNNTGRNFLVNQGTFSTANYAFTVGALQSTTTSVRTITLGSSTVTVTIGSGDVFRFSNPANLTFNAGTSQINIALASATNFIGGAKTFNNVAFTGVGGSLISDVNTFNNLNFPGRTGAGVSRLIFGASQTINGTLTLSAGTNATMRSFVRSDSAGVARTLTCAAVASLTDIDFQDITIAGAAAPVSGTRLGDCKGNSGFTGFAAAKTVYWNLAGSNNWSATAWATTSGGAVAVENFPLAQDTVIFTSTSPASGATTTVNASYQVGTVDLSARTSNTMTLNIGAGNELGVYGNFINGTGSIYSALGAIIFGGRTTQNVTNAGVTFTQAIILRSPGGVVNLLDSLTTSVSFGGALEIVNGTLNDNGYNITLSGSASGVFTSYTNARSINVNGLLTIAGFSGWDASTSTNFTVTGVGTISLTSALAREFRGGSIKTYPVINQGGTGFLTITGSNNFINITNTAIGPVDFTGGTTQAFENFNLNGVSGNLLQLTSTNTTPVTLRKPSTWNVGAGSTDSGNNTGLSFTGTNPDFLNISYITGVFPASVTGAISEVIAADSTEASSASISPTVAESAIAQDTSASRLIGTGTVGETVEATDGIASLGVLSGSVNEAATSTDSISSSVLFLVLVLEATTADDALTSSATLSSAVAENATSTDGLFAGLTYNSAVLVAVTATDGVVRFLLWEPVDDGQTPNWQNVNNTQSLTWTDIDDSQTPGWTPINS